MKLIVAKDITQLFKRQRVELRARGPHIFEVSNHEAEGAVVEWPVASAHGQLVGADAVSRLETLSEQLDAIIS